MTNRQYLEDQDAEEPDDFIISLTAQVSIFISSLFLKIFMCSIVILLLAYSIDFYLIIFTTPIGVGKTSKREKMWICQYDNI
jgi:hypothetical protein